MTHHVDIKRSAYVGNRAGIEAFHVRLSIEQNQSFFYSESGILPVAYRYSFVDPNVAMLFKLTFG